MRAKSEDPSYTTVGDRNLKLVILFFNSLFQCIKLLSIITEDIVVLN